MPGAYHYSVAEYIQLMKFKNAAQAAAAKPVAKSCCGGNAAKPAVTPAASCCGGSASKSAPSAGGGCCGPATFTPEQLAVAIGYSSGELASTPAESNMGLSCGNPTAIASLKAGEVVLDLGAIWYRGRSKRRGLAIFGRVGAEHASGRARVGRGARYGAALSCVPREQRTARRPGRRVALDRRAV